MTNLNNNNNKSQNNNKTKINIKIKTVNNIKIKLIRHNTQLRIRAIIIKSMNNHQNKEKFKSVIQISYKNKKLVSKFMKE